MQTCSLEYSDGSFWSSSVRARYKIIQPTIALFFEEGRQVARTIAAGSVISAESIEGDQLIEVEWSEKTVMMFAQDIRSRGERMDPPSNPESNDTPNSTTLL